MTLSYEFPLTFPIDWGESGTPTTTGVSFTGKDLHIYYNSLTGNDFISCRCSRWDVDNYSFVVETWLKESDLQNILNNVTPGATGELYKILGKPQFFDSTWQGENTLRFVPSSNCPSRLWKMRQPKIGYVKNLTTHPIEGSKGWIEVKFECFLSGNTL